MLIGLTLFNSCKKETISTSSEETIISVCSENIDLPEETLITAWVYFDETYCADPWGNSNDSESEKLINIENYLNDLNVAVFEIEISEENVPETCLSCGCHSGFVIKLHIKEEDVSVLITADDFYE